MNCRFNVKLLIGLKKNTVFNKEIPVVVLGALDTGLGIIRSLGQEGIDVFCYDFKTEIARYSRYCKFIHALIHK